MKAKVIKTGEVVDVYHEPQHGQITNIYKESVLVNGRMWTEDELEFSVKANEAPERIYLLSTPNRMLDGWYRDKSSIPSSFKQVEYTRTDAFIDDACKWLKENAYFYVNDYTGSLNEDKLVEDFRKYWKESNV